MFDIGTYIEYTHAHFNEIMTLFSSRIDYWAIEVLGSCAIYIFLNAHLHVGVEVQSWTWRKV